jgi:superfamily II DNA/RNA helicase
LSIYTACICKSIKSDGVDNVVCFHRFRLDVESKLPEQLKLAFICCRSEDKSAALLCLLKHVIKPESMTVLFAATKHHVEYLHMVRYSTTLCFMKESKLFHAVG